MLSQYWPKPEHGQLERRTPGREIHSGLRYPPLIIWNSIYHSLSHFKDCFIQTLNWLKVLYCRHRLVAYWVPFPLPYNLWLLSEDFPEHFPSLGIVTERMRYLRYTSPKRVTDFKLEWFLSLAHFRGKFKSLSCKLFIPFSPHCCHTS